MNYNQYGYTIGGPVYIPKVYDGRNRTFFSTSLERDADKRDGSHLAFMPSALERQGNSSRTLDRTQTDARIGLSCPALSLWAGIPFVT